MFPLPQLGAGGHVGDASRGPMAAEHDASPPTGEHPTDQHGSGQGQGQERSVTPYDAGRAAARAYGPGHEREIGGTWTGADTGLHGRPVADLGSEARVSWVGYRCGGGPGSVVTTACCRLVMRGDKLRMAKWGVAGAERALGVPACVRVHEGGVVLAGCLLCLNGPSVAGGGVEQVPKGVQHLCNAGPSRCGNVAALHIACPGTTGTATP